MKKVIFALAAVVALAACSNEQTVSFDKGEAIGFDTFIENSTRAAYDGSYTNATLASFQVYGTVTGTGEGEQTANIFDGVVVTKGEEGVGTNGWAYDVLYKQYWIPGNNYAFFAIADGNVANTTEVVKNDVNMPTSIKLYDASQQCDILTADASVENYEKTTNGTNVPFTFKHIMSKAKFTFKNTIAVDTGYSYKVTNVEILNAPMAGVYTITDGDSGVWAFVDADQDGNNDTYTLAFGDVVANGKASEFEAAYNLAYNTSAESNYDRLLVPGQQLLEVQFDYQLFKDGNLVDTQVNVETSANVTLVSGNAYNFVVALGEPGDPITFSLETITAWDEDSNDENSVNDNEYEFE